MTEFDDFQTGDHEERQALGAMAERLQRERPIPAAGFRSRLRSRLLTDSPEGASAVARVRIFALSCAGLGTLLLAVAALGTASVGPFAA
jgi:hypothetical protein